MDFICKHFDELTTTELYEILRLRAEIFVVEQNCVYQDLDGNDYNSYHVFSMEKGSATSCLRLYEPAPGRVILGRVVTRTHGTGLGGKLLHEGVRLARELFPGAERITIHAQCYAQGYYAKEGFRVSSGEFLEDGIPHVEMVLEL